MADTTSRLQQNLDSARTGLQIAQALLHISRCLGASDEQLRQDEQGVYRCLDRVWDLQCMVGGSL